MFVFGRQLEGKSKMKICWYENDNGANWPGATSKPNTKQTKIHPCEPKHLIEITTLYDLSVIYKRKRKINRWLKRGIFTHGFGDKNKHVGTILFYLFYRSAECIQI